MDRERRRLPDDWYGGEIPVNVILGRDVYLDSSYAFAAFHSVRERGLVLGDACGVYDRAAFVVGPQGIVQVGAFTVLNGTYIVCNDRVTIGEHCLLSWGVVITDTWLGASPGVEARRHALRVARSDARLSGAVSPPLPVTVEDNAWIGFDTVIMPGVTVGRGAIVGCKSVVTHDLPAYAVALGNPARIHRYLDPDDTAAAREKAFRDCVRPRV